jgi:hypothetical protein
MVGIGLAMAIFLVVGLKVRRFSIAARVLICLAAVAAIAFVYK